MRPDHINNPVTKDDICLRFLSNKMEATADMVGRAIHEQYPGGIHGGYRAVGAAILGRLKYLDLVYRLPELNAWRLTKKGREHITTK